MPKKYVPQYDPNSKEKNEMSLLTTSFPAPDLSAEEFHKKYGRGSSYYGSHRSGGEVGLSDERRRQLMNVARFFLMQEYVYHWEHEEWYEKADLYPDRGGYGMSQEEYDAKVDSLKSVSSLYLALCGACQQVEHSGSSKEKKEFAQLLAALTSPSHTKRQLAALSLPDHTADRLVNLLTENNTYVPVEILPDSFYRKYAADLEPQPQGNQNQIVEHASPELLQKLKKGRPEAEFRKEFVRRSGKPFREEYFEEDYNTAQEDARLMDAIRGKRPRLVDPATLQGGNMTLPRLRGEAEHFLDSVADVGEVQEPKPNVQKPKPNVPELPDREVSKVPDEYLDRDANDLYLAWFDKLPLPDPDNLPGTDDERAEDESQELAKNFYADKYLKNSHSYVAPTNAEFLRKMEELSAGLVEKRRGERAALAQNKEWNRYWEAHAQVEEKQWKDDLRQELTALYTQKFNEFHEKNWSALFRPLDRSRYGDTLRVLWAQENEQKIRQAVEKAVNEKLAAITDPDGETYKNWLSSVQEKWIKDRESGFTYDEAEEQETLDGLLNSTDDVSDSWGEVVEAVQDRIGYMSESLAAFEALADLAKLPDAVPSRFYFRDEIDEALDEAARLAERKLPLNAQQQRTLLEMRGQLHADLAALPTKEALSDKEQLLKDFENYRKQKPQGKLTEAQARTEAMLSNAVKAGRDQSTAAHRKLLNARRELNMDRSGFRNPYASPHRMYRADSRHASYADRIARVEEMTKTVDHLNHNDQTDPDVAFYGWLKARTDPEQFRALQEQLRTEGGRKELQTLRRIFLCSHDQYGSNAQKMEKVTRSLFSPVVPLEDPLSPYVSGAFTDQSVADEDLVAAHNMCRSIPLNDFIGTNWSQNQPIPIEAKDIETVVAGAFLREDVLGLMAGTTFNSYENVSGMALQPSGDSDLEKMLDPFFNLTVNGDSRRVANLPRIAAPRARGLAGFIIKTYSEGNLRPLVDCLDNMIRVSANYARKRPSNDHSVYASSKMVADAMALMEKMGLQKYSSLNLDELREAQAAATRYKAQTEIVKLRNELADQLLDNQLRKIAANVQQGDNVIREDVPDPLELPGVRDKIGRVKALESYCAKQAAYAGNQNYYLTDSVNPEQPEAGTSFRYLSPEEMSASLNFDGYISVLQNRENIRRFTNNLDLHSTPEMLAAELNQSPAQNSTLRFHPTALKENVAFLIGDDIRPAGTQLLEFAKETAKYGSELKEYANFNHPPKEKTFTEKIASLFSSEEAPQGDPKVTDIAEVTQRVQHLGLAIQELNTLAQDDPLNLYSSKERLTMEKMFYDTIANYDREQFRKDFARVLKAREHKLWHLYTEEAGENLIGDGSGYKQDYERACRVFDQMQEAAARWRPVLNEQIRIREDSEYTAQMLLDPNNKTSSLYGVKSVSDAWDRIKQNHHGMDLSDYLLRKKEAKETSSSVQYDVGKKLHISSDSAKKLQTLRSTITNQTLESGNKPALKHNVTKNFEKTAKLKKLQTNANLRQSMNDLKKQSAFVQGGSKVEQGPERDPEQRVLSLGTQKLSLDDNNPQQNVSAGSSQKYAGMRNLSTMRSLNTMTKEKLNRTRSIKSGSTFVRTKTTIVGIDLGSSKTKNHGAPQRSGAYGKLRDSRDFRNMASCDENFVAVALGDDPLLPAKFLASEEELNEAAQTEAYSRRIFQAILSRQALQKAQLSLGVAEKTILSDREIRDAAREDVAAAEKISQGYEHRRKEQQIRAKRAEKLLAEERKAESQKLADQLTRGKVHHDEVKKLEKLYKDARKKRDDAIKAKHQRFEDYLKEQNIFDADMRQYKADWEDYQERLDKFNDRAGKRAKYLSDEKEVLNKVIEARGKVIALQNTRQDNLKLFNESVAALEELRQENSLAEKLDPKNVMPDPDTLHLAGDIQNDNVALQSEQQQLAQDGGKDLEKNALDILKRKLDERKAALDQRAAALATKKAAIDAEKDNIYLEEADTNELKNAVDAQRELKKEQVAQKKEVAQKEAVVQKQPVKAGEPEKKDEPKAGKGITEALEEEESDDSFRFVPIDGGRISNAREVPEQRGQLGQLYYRTARHNGGKDEHIKWYLIDQQADTETREELTEQAEQLLERVISARNLLIREAAVDKPALLPLFKDGLQAYDELIRNLAEKVDDPKHPGQKMYRLKADPAMPDWIASGTSMGGLSVATEAAVAPPLLALKACSNYLMLPPEAQKTVGIQELTSQAWEDLQPMAEERIENFSIEKLASCCASREDWEQQNRVFVAVSRLNTAISENSSPAAEEQPFLLVDTDMARPPVEAKEQPNGAPQWFPPQEGNNRQAYLKDLGIARLEMQRYADHTDPLLRAIAANALQECEKLERSVAAYREPRLVHADGSLSSALLSMYVFRKAAQDYETYGSVLDTHETVQDYVQRQKSVLQAELNGEKLKKPLYQQPLAFFRQYLPASDTAKNIYEGTQELKPLLDESLREVAQYSTTENATFRYVLDRMAAFYREALRRTEDGESLNDLLYEYRKDRDGNYRVLPTESHVLASFGKRLITTVQNNGLGAALKDLNFEKRISDEYLTLAKQLDLNIIKPVFGASKTDEEYLDDLRDSMEVPTSLRGAVLFASVHPSEKEKQAQLETDIHDKSLQIKGVLERISKEGYLAKNPRERTASSVSGPYFHKLLDGAARGYQHFHDYISAGQVKGDSSISLFISVNKNSANRRLVPEYILTPHADIVNVAAANLMLQDIKRLHEKDPSRIFSVSEDAYNQYIKTATEQLLAKRENFGGNADDLGKSAPETQRFLAEYIWKDVPAEENFYTSRLRYDRAATIESNFRKDVERREELKKEHKDALDKETLTAKEKTWYEKNTPKPQVKKKPQFLSSGEEAILKAKKEAHEKNLKQDLEAHTKQLKTLNDKLAELTQRQNVLTERNKVESPVAQAAGAQLQQEQNVRVEKGALKAQAEKRREIFLVGKAGSSKAEIEAFRHQWFGDAGEAEMNRAGNYRNLGFNELQPPQNGDNAPQNEQPVEFSDRSAAPTRNELLVECYLHAKVLDKFLENPSVNLSSKERAFLTAVAKNAFDAYTRLFNNIAANGNTPAQFLDEDGLLKNDLADISLARDVFDFSSVRLDNDGEPVYDVNRLLPAFAAQNVEEQRGFYDDEIVNNEGVINDAKNINNINNINNVNNPPEENRDAALRTQRAQDAWNYFRENVYRENSSLNEQVLHDSYDSALHDYGIDLTFRTLNEKEAGWIYKEDPNAPMPTPASSEERAKRNADFLRYLMTDNRSMDGLDVNGRRKLLDLVNEAEAKTIVGDIQRMSPVRVNIGNDEAPAQPDEKPQQHSRVDHLLLAAQQLQPLATAIREAVSSHAEIPALAQYAAALEALTPMALELHGYHFNTRSRALEALPNGARQLKLNDIAAFRSFYADLYASTAQLSRQKELKGLVPKLQEISKILESDDRTLGSLRVDPAHPKTLTDLLQEQQETAQHESETFIFDSKKNALFPAKSRNGLMLEVNYVDKENHERKAFLSTLGAAYSHGAAKQATFNQNAAMYWTLFPAYRKHFEALYDKDYQLYREHCYGENGKPDAQKVIRFLAQKRLPLKQEDLGRFMAVLNSIEDELVAAEKAASAYSDFIGENEPLKMRSVAFFNLAKLAGAENCVPETKLVQMRMFGKSMPLCYSEKAVGINLGEPQANDRGTFAGWVNSSIVPPAANVPGAAPVYEPKVSPQCLRDLTRLQLLDYLAGTFVRPKENILYKIDSRTNTLDGIQLIGNETTFPSKGVPRDLRMPKFLPKSMADEFLKLSEADLTQLYGPAFKLGTPGLNGLRTRLTAIQTAIRTAQNNPASPMQILSDEEFFTKKFSDLRPEAGMSLFDAISDVCREQSLNAFAQVEAPAQEQEAVSHKLVQERSPSELEQLHGAFHALADKLEKADAWWHINSSYYDNVLRTAKTLTAALNRANVTNDPDNEVGLEQQYRELRQYCAEYVQTHQKAGGTEAQSTEIGRDRMLYVRQLGSLANLRLLAIEEKKVQIQLAEAIAGFRDDPGQNNDPAQHKKLLAQITSSPVFREMVKGKTAADMQRLTTNKITLTKELRDANFRVQNQREKAPVRNYQEVVQPQEQGPQVN